MRAADGHFLFVCKAFVPPDDRGISHRRRPPTLSRPVKRGRERFDYRYRWLNDVPLRGDADALTVNWLMIEIVNAAGTVTYRNSFITDLEVGPDTVAELAACGRARWKIENESFNVLKNNGYNLEHNFGHGKNNLSAVFVSLNLLAFAFHTVCDLAEDLLARSDGEDGNPRPVLRKPAIHHHLPDLPHWTTFWQRWPSPDPRLLPSKQHAIPSRCPI